MTFLNGLLLFGAAAAAIPLVIQLLNRSKFQIVDWGAMHLLDRVIQDNQRRIRWREWLLLLIRCAIPIVLALCLARPLLVSQWAEGGSSAGAAIMLLDDTISMAAAEENGESPWERATDFLQQLPARLPETTPRLFLLGSQTREVAVSDEIAETLAQLQPLSSGIAPINALLTVLDSAARYPGGPHHIVVVSDFQAAEWRSLSEAEIDQLQAARAKFAVPPMITLFSTQLASEVEQTDLAGRRANVAIERLEVSPARWTAGDRVEIVAVLTNDGDQVCDELQVEFLRDDKVLHRVAVDVPARGMLQVPFTYQIPETVVPIETTQPAVVALDTLQPANYFPVSVRLRREDAIAADNFALLLATIAPPLDVVVVTNSRETTADREQASADFLLAALSPFAFAGGRREGNVNVDSMQAEQCEVGQLTEQRLEQCEVVILADATQLAQAELRALDAFVAAGGGVVIFSGSRMLADIAWVNEQLWRDGNGLLPAAAGKSQADNLPADIRLAENRWPTRVSGARVEHPALSYFNDNLAAPLTAANVQSALPIDVTRRADGCRVVASFENGIPFVLELPRGSALGQPNSGAILWVNTTADPSWTNLPLRPAFLPFVQRLVEHVAPAVSQSQTAPPGQPGEVVLAGQWQKDDLRFTFPSSSLLPKQTTSPEATFVSGAEVRGLKIESEGQLSRVRWLDTRAAGLYRVEAGDIAGENVGSWFLAPRAAVESQREYLNAAQLTRFAESWGATTTDSLADYLQSYRENMVGREIWRWLWWLVLSLLVIERIVVWSLGRLA
ncbi:BatA domain-containing protein [Planctomycetaceae bacterium SH139]